PTEMDSASLGSLLTYTDVPKDFLTYIATHASPEMATAAQYHKSRPILTHRQNSWRALPPIRALSIPTYAAWVRRTPIRQPTPWNT
ncbi:MAG: hypothetical protein MI924_16845, partial [Chloroflexales bacterium]|nr:hypothetical protein [Chloroflexales bacterium]